MESVASAPGKAILFGEHAVVYGKPAIAVAINQRATVAIKKANTGYTTIKSPSLGVEATLDPKSKSLDLKKGKKGILGYIKKALEFYHDKSPIDVCFRMDMPIGAGLGSSAAVTVATIAALDNYHNRRLRLSSIARRAHKIEVEVQGAASPLDTSTCTYGGLIYLDEKREVTKIKGDIGDSLVIGYTTVKGDTAAMVAKVKEKMGRNPRIMGLIMDAIAIITKNARKALEADENGHLGELMNINQGLLDSIGVNTRELSEMIYLSREAGALGSKITGAGGGGSIIAYCPGRVNEVLKALKVNYNSMKGTPSRVGVIIH